MNRTHKISKFRLKFKIENFLNTFEYTKQEYEKSKLYKDQKQIHTYGTVLCDRISRIFKIFRQITFLNWKDFHK